MFVFISYSTTVSNNKLIIIKIIIAPLSILSEDEWGDLQCMYTACQAATSDGALITDIGVHERDENERQSENDCEVRVS